MRPALRVGLLLMLVALGATGLRAQEGAGDHDDSLELPEGLIVVQHIIRPGDTFITLTREYLGEGHLWRINQRLNPEMIERRLVPGERMRVLIDPARIPIAARVAQHSGDVEAQPAPLGWLQARDDDLLIERDAARTGRNSSAELRLHDGTSVFLTEQSLVFLRNLGRGLSTVPANRRTQQVEVLSGQADLSSLAGSNAARDDVEVILGSSTLRLPAEFPLRTRTAREEDTARVGLYDGNGTFQSDGGTAVDLTRGEGVIAAAGEEPRKETLLAAPDLLEPAAGAEVVRGSGDTASWTIPADTVATYTLEVCRDPSCGRVVERSRGLTDTSAPLPDLPPGEYHWRVTAASATGLDGFPSESRTMTVVDTPSDAEPPQVALELLSFGVPHQGLPAFDATPPLAFDAVDAGSGVVRTGLVIDGGTEQATDAPLPTGRLQVALFAVDGAGNRAESSPIELFVDAEPPTLDLAPREAPDLTPPAVERPERRRARRRAREQGITFPAPPVFALSPQQALGFSLDGIEWKPIAAFGMGLLTDSSGFDLVVNDGFCVQRMGTDGEAQDPRRCGRAFLTVVATDEHTGVKVLSARRVGTELVLTATDEVGNQAEMRLLVTDTEGTPLPEDA